MVDVSLTYIEYIRVITGKDFGKGGGDTASVSPRYTYQYQFPFTFGDCISCGQIVLRHMIYEKRLKDKDGIRKADTVPVFTYVVDYNLFCGGSIPFFVKKSYLLAKLGYVFFSSLYPAFKILHEGIAC